MLVGIAEKKAKRVNRRAQITLLILRNAERESAMNLPDDPPLNEEIASDFQANIKRIKMSHGRTKYNYGLATTKLSGRIRNKKNRKVKKYNKRNRYNKK